MTPLQQQYTQQYGPGNYVPNVFIQYWAMRVMAYLGVVVLLIAVWGLWLIRRKKLATSRRVLVGGGVGCGAAVLDEYRGLVPDRERPAAVDRAGHHADQERDLADPVSVTWLWISLIAFVLLYGTLATVDLLLMLKYSREQLPPPRAEADADAPVPAVLY